MNRRARPRSLRARLVISCLVLIAVVAAAIGFVTTIALRSYLYRQLDDQVSQIAMRAAGPEPAPQGEEPGPPVPGGEPFDFVTKGAPVGTIGARIEKSDESDGSKARVTGGEISTDRSSSGGVRTQTVNLTRAQLGVLDGVPRDGGPHTVSLPGRGDYRVQYANGVRGTYYVGRPTTEVDGTIRTLFVLELSVAGAGLTAAGIASAAIVGFALRPLRRVAATATRVSGLPLHSGEVALHERVPDAEADPRTEVGQVGAALNRMLDHVHSALDARQRSETRVRQFVADASHELRTPLASIRGYAELTRRGHGPVDPDVQHALRRIESEAGRMTGLVEDMLLLARLDTGRRLTLADTDVRPLVVNAVADAHAADPEHVWRLELPEEEQRAARVPADPQRLHQVLVNLLANAASHTPRGTAVTARVRQAGSRLLMEVEDEGPGIPPDLLPYVFERFARGDTSRSRASGSTGLGLAIVQAVVAAHGGEVRVQSRPGRTVFTVDLPTAADASPGNGASRGHPTRPGLPDGNSQA
ncbi:sensor histidine kinase [Streptomyces nanshensis]|uniref:histidine kinase n=1 Tax=Streptomyces nanshensis TaxID=518642 RepID=A0A1E7LCV2_9ACTN|nr:HAMP domain-containing sensor histidine kinase [Streptomyces nanshensis]OEV13980.1 histidine kinase [Streptomyces nanshensis]